MKKLAVKFRLLGVLIALFLLIAIDWLTYSQVKAFLITDVQRHLHHNISLTKELLDLTLFKEKKSSQLQALASRVRQLTGLRVTFIDLTGRMLADSDVPFDRLGQVENHLHRPEVQQALQTDVGFDIRRSATIGKRLIYYCEPLRENRKILGLIRFAMFADQFDQQLHRLIWLLIGINLLLITGMILFVVLSWRFFQRGLGALRGRLAQLQNSAAFDPLGPQPEEEWNELAVQFDDIRRRWLKKREELEAEARQLYDVLYSLQEGVAVFNRRGSLIYHNGKFLKILGLANINCLGRAFYDWIEFPPLVQDIERFLENREPFKRRIKYYSGRYIEYRILPVRQSGNQESIFLITLQDVTHLQRLEIIRRNFVANVSHEFKTPLTSIRGYAETLQGGVEDEELRRKFLEKIVKQTQHLENLVGDLLQLSRIERREVEQLMLLNPLPLFREVVEDFRPLTAGKQLQLHYREVDVSENVALLGADFLLHALLMNLLSNAVHYSKPGGNIHVRVSVRGEKLRVEVEDQGIGILPREQEHIFERFYRGEEARELHAAGTGLGLSIVKHIVEILSGQIGVESEPGKGSLFWFELPLQKNVSGPNAETPPENAAQS